jgi:hypothetical protein
VSVVSNGGEGGAVCLTKTVDMVDLKIEFKSVTRVQENGMEE